MKLLKGLPVLALSLLSACGDDNEVLDYTYPSTYEFRSLALDQDNSVVSGRSTAFHQLIIELDSFIKSEEIQQVSSNSPQRIVERLNRIYELGTKTGEDFGNGLVARNLYTDSFGVTHINRLTTTGLALDISDFSQIEEDWSLDSVVTGNGLAAPSLPNQTTNNSDAEVGLFIGFPLYTDIPNGDVTRDMENGNEMPDALLNDWFEQLAELASDPAITSTVSDTGLHLDVLINELLLGSVIYSGAVNLNLNSGLLTQNLEPSNQTTYDNAVKKHADAVERVGERREFIKKSERKEYTKNLEKLAADEIRLEKQAVKDAAEDVLDGIDKLEDPNGWLAAKTIFDQAEDEFGEANTAYTDAFREHSDAVRTIRDAKSAYQIAIDYEAEALSDIPEISPSTSLEYFWDGAFSLFGLLRDHSQYTDDELMVATDMDSNGDGTIQIAAEMVYPYARIAARIDATSELASHDFSQTIYNAFLQGRQIISANHGKDPVSDQGFHAEVAAQANIIVESWDRLIAANTIHFINLTISALQDENALGDLEGAYFENWSHLKGVAISLQFSPYMALSVDDLIKVHDYIGTQPILDASSISTHISNLMSARDILQRSYDFADSNVMHW